MSDKITINGREYESPINSPQLKNLQKQLQEFTSTPEYKNYTANKMAEDISKYIKQSTFEMQSIPTPEDRLRFLTEKLDITNSELKTQTESMQKIQYENMKLNAQIDVLNKTLDSNREELYELQKANGELKAVNTNLENSNRHYWRNTGLISFGAAIISFILGLYSTEVKSLLVSILHLMQ